MNITDVRIRKMTKEGNMKAVASITIDNELAIHDIKIIEGEKGLFIAMPSAKRPTAITATSHIPFPRNRVILYKKQYWKPTRKCFFHSIGGTGKPGAT